MLTNDSLPQKDVPRGTVTKLSWNNSSVYPGTKRNYWVYIPDQYVETEPACLMVFLDGAAYVHTEGLVRVPTVFDNLIHKGDIPVIIGVFIDPGEKEVVWDNRGVEYVTLGDTYSHFLLDEILPEATKDLNLVDNAAGRATCGMSDGGLCAFTVAWQRPDIFSKVISHIGSYTRLRVGSEYPFLIRQTRGNPKPIRVFLQDGENDLNIEAGSWTLGNINMEAALKFARYDYRFELGTGGHDLNHGGEIFPDTLRWIWRDYPGVKGADDPQDLEPVIGQWDMVINAFGQVRHNVLTVTEQNGALVAELNDEMDGDVEVTSITFKDDILTFEYKAPPSQSNWGKGTIETMTAWIKVAGSTFDGALSSEDSSETKYDFSIKGARKVRMS